MIELIITSVVSIILSLGGSFVFFKEKRKDIEVDTLNKVIETLQEEAKTKNDYLTNKDNLIDKLYKENGEFRDRNNELSTQNALLSYMRCTINNCSDRRPPREFSEDNKY